MGAAAAEVTWRYAAFELDSTIPAEGVDAHAHLEAKYDAASLVVIFRRLADALAAGGLPLRDLAEPGVRPNTFAAHRLLTAAFVDGVVVQQDVAEGLFRAYWADGADVGDRDVLMAIACGAGMDGDRARDALTSEEVGAAARDEERRGQEVGIHAVPTFVVDGRLIVMGAQPPAVLAQAVRQALAAAAS